MILPIPVICVVFALLVALLCMFGLNNLLLLYFNVKPCTSSLERKEILREWPYVTIQVATYNEGYVVTRLLDACLKIDYPRDKMEIIVVDDSTDETINILREYERRYYPRIKVIHRGRRDGYKAGALNEALRYSKGEFILILDADSIPEQDFLKKTIPLFFTNGRLGFAQGRPKYLNEDESWLTKTFALINDWFAYFTQASLSRQGMVMSFIGHAGVFRRRALEDAGGWMSDTITEDMDMAYRLQLKGWEATYVEDAVSLEEVPPSYYASMVRFKRHLKGPLQNLIKHGGAVIKHRRFSAIKKIEAIIQMAYPTVYLIGLICLIMTAAVYMIVPGKIIDGFWHSGAGFISSAFMLLSLPYIALVISPIPSTLILAVTAAFALILLIMDKRGLGKIDVKTIFGTLLIWNDNILNCLTPIFEILVKKGGEWVATERTLKRHSFSADGRLREAIFRILSSLLVSLAFLKIALLNFSLNSLGILLPAALWLCSAYLIIEGK